MMRRIRGAGRGNPAPAVIISCLLAATVVPSARSAAGDDVWKKAEPGYEWSFPEDHWAHPDYKTEWWYFTGHLAEAGAAEPRYGFQFTFFRIGLTPEVPPHASAWTASDLIMGHASVTDVETGAHLFSEVLYRASSLLGGFGVYPDSVLAWSRAPAGTEGRWSVVWTGDGFRIVAEDARRGLGFDLEATPTKALIFQGPGGYSRKSDDESGAASLYYSHTRMSVTGSVDGGAGLRSVTGQCWMDREIFTNTLAPGQVGWDWLSLQLDDGRELMLYRLRKADGGIDYGLGTLVTAEGDVLRLGLDDWTWTPGQIWRSPRTGAEYPVRWRLTVPAAGIDVTLKARVDAQENISSHSGVRYWEGAVIALPFAEEAGDGRAAPVERRPRGYGYVELTGYGKGNRPPI
jgi:predicted secreted hydrolase